MLNGQQVGPYKVQDIQGWIEAVMYRWKMQPGLLVVKHGFRLNIPGIYEPASSHSESKHLIPPLKHIQEICLLFLLVMHTRIQSICRNYAFA